MAPPPAYAPSIQAPPEAAVDIGNLDEQLRYITRQIEALRPSSEFEQVIAAIRSDLADIRQQLTEALPRHAVESLEIEVEALAKRLDHSRDAGVDRACIGRARARARRSPRRAARPHAGGESGRLRRCGAGACRKRST